MAIKRVIQIGDKAVEFKASAAIPRIYRIKFKRDVFKDLMKLEQALKTGKQEPGGHSTMGIDDLEMFENIAYTMAKHADSTIPDDIYDWLDCFDVFDIYIVLPKIIELWGDNIETEVEAKKKLIQVQGS